MYFFETKFCLEHGSNRNGESMTKKHGSNKNGESIHGSNSNGGSTTKRKIKCNLIQNSTRELVECNKLPSKKSIQLDHMTRVTRP